MENNYTNVKAVSQDITKIAELSEQLKLLHFHRQTTDENSVRKYETEFGDKKLNLIQWLSHDDNYNSFKSSPDGKHALFMKTVKDGYFEHEIGLNSSLKDKVYRDFSEKLAQTNPEELMTQQEKKNLKHYEDNNVPEEKRSFFVKETKYATSVYNKEKCFNQNMVTFQTMLPKKETIDSGARSLLDVIKKCPYFLLDHPNHFLVNMGTTKGKAPTLEDIHNVIQDSSYGNPEAKEKISSYSKLFKDFIDKNPQKEAIAEIKEKAGLSNKNINSPKLT